MKHNNFYNISQQEQTQTSGDVVLHAFDPVTVRLSLDSKNIQHEKFVLQLVSPYVEGFSVAPLTESENKHKIKVEPNEPKIPAKKSKKK